MEDYGADKTATNSIGKTAADLAVDCDFDYVFAYLDRQAARAKAAKIKDELKDADVVHIISTRYRRDQSQLDGPKDLHGRVISCDPFRTAREVKKHLEKGKGVVVYDPNGYPRDELSTAFLTAGKAEEAHAIWLLNWRWALSLVKQTGGRCVQIVVKPGLSDMQKAEASMAADKGVEVVQLDFTDVEVYATEDELRWVEGMTELQAIQAPSDTSSYKKYSTSYMLAEYSPSFSKRSVFSPDGKTWKRRSVFDSIDQ